MEFNGFFLYQSIKYPEWFVAINRAGKSSRARVDKRLRAKLFLQRHYDENWDKNKRYKFNQKRIMKKLRRMQRKRRF